MTHPTGDSYWLPCPGRIDYAAARFYRPCNAAAAVRESMAVDPYLEAPAGFFAIDVRHELLEIIVAFTAQSLGNEYRFPIGRLSERSVGVRIDAARGRLVAVYHRVRLDVRATVRRPDETHPKPGPPDLGLDHVD